MCIILVFHPPKVLIVKEDTNGSYENEIKENFYNLLLRNTTQNDCINGHCLSRFFEDKVPWLGHITRSFDLADNTFSMKIECFSSCKNELELKSIDDEIFPHDQSSKIPFGSGVYVTKFLFEKLPCDSKMKRISCNDEEEWNIKKSRYNSDIGCKRNSIKWSKWTKWTDCNSVKEKVTRTRTDLTNPENKQKQSKYCKCSDVVKLTSPR